MTELLSGERQVAAKFGDIRADHRMRYEWVAKRVAGKRVLDAGCGIGYGSRHLMDALCTVTAFDKSAEAIACAEQYYKGPTYLNLDAEELAGDVKFDAITAFEFVEHLERPEEFLAKARTLAPKLYLSVPNEREFPWHPGCAFHYRHYTHDQIEELLTLNGWRVVGWHGQIGLVNPVTEGKFGRTIVVEAERMKGFKRGPVPIDPPEEPSDPRIQALKLPGRPLPKRIAIVAMGGQSQPQYHDQVQKAGARAQLFDEVWTLNACLDDVRADRVFLLDDWAIQERRTVDDQNRVGIAAVLDVARQYDGWVCTAKKYSWMGDNWHEYPLDLAIECGGSDYLNNSVPLMFVMALAMGVKYINLYGTDYDYGGDAYKSERGRGCLEYWIGKAEERGVQVNLPPTTTLFDARSRAIFGQPAIYGFWTDHLHFYRRDDGTWAVERTELPPEKIPTAEEIEAIMSHDARVRS